MFKKYLVAWIVLCFVTTTQAQKRDSLYFDTTGLYQKDYSAAWDSMMRSKIPNLPKDSAALLFSKTITALDLKTMLYELTSEKCAGRETGYPGQKEAEKYLVSRLKMYGLKPAGDNGTYIQEYKVNEDTLLRCSMEIGGKKYQHYQDFYSYLNQNRNDSVAFDKIIDAGYGIEAENYNDYQSINAKGAVIMIHSGEPKLNDTTYVVSGGKKPSEWSTKKETKINAATKNGARVVLIVVNNASADVASNFRIKKRPMYLEADTVRNHTCNVYYISKDMAREIFKNSGKNYDNFEKKLQENENPVNVKLKIKTRIVYAKQSITRLASNVAGLIEGSDKKDEIVVFSAHYDHLGIQDGKMYPGADDDGSGTVGVMEIAQAFAIAQKKGKGPRRSLLFLCFSGEEKGLLGSEYYASHPLVPMEKTVVDLNIDMIGRVDAAHEKKPNYVYIIGDEKLSSDLRPISEKANNTYLNMTLDYKYNVENEPNQYYSRSDHYNFAKNGVPVIFYFKGSHNDYHKPTDTFEKINFGILLNTTKLVYYTGWDIANRPERLKVDKR